MSVKASEPCSKSSLTSEARVTLPKRTMLAALVVSVLATTAFGHGFVTEPRSRGALFTQRPVRQLARQQDVTWAYCPHCQNGRGVHVLRNYQGNVINNRWIPYKPLQGMFRNGVSICGDPDGKNDHSASGMFKAPSFMPFVAEYQAGGVANFEYDFTTPHGGYLEFYLCDVSESGDISRASFQSGKCHLLERAYNEACESGNDRDCGPIDQNHPTRWYLPCRVSDARDQDQIIGGSSGKMSFKIPNTPMQKAVVHAYWLTGNNCNPDGLKEYYTNGKWASVQNSKCPGDGGTIGGYREDHTGTCTTQAGKFPEEFWNCADVKVVGGGSSNTYSNVSPQGSQTQNLQHSPGKQGESSSKHGESRGHTGTSSQNDANGNANSGSNSADHGNDGSNQVSESDVNQSDLRPGCMPPVDKTRTDKGYLDYVKQLERHCRRGH